MVRFKKGTLDHDSNGRKGGSKPAPKAKSVAKPAEKPAEPTEPLFKRDDAFRIVFEQGVMAGHSGIDRRDSPHPEGPSRDAWLEGWDHANG